VEKVILYKDLMPLCNQTANQRKEEKKIPCFAVCKRVIMTKTPKLKKNMLCRGYMCICSKGKVISKHA